MLAYQGFAQGDLGYTGAATGLEAFIVTRSGMSLITGISSKPRGLVGGGVPTADLIMAYRGDGGHWLASQGSLFATSTARNDPSAVSTTHLTPASNNGDIYAEGDLEIDGTAYFDGPIDHNGSTLGLFSTAPVAQQTVTGSRASGAALTDLLTKLANYGLIVDSTTA
jgi:hypothetical protein